MYTLSICIPTYNRADHLANCLNSIALNRGNWRGEIQVCVSNNCSDDHTEEVVRNAAEKIDIIYKKNESNIGMARNFLEVVNMSNSEFVWIIGDDDLLLPFALETLLNIIKKSKDVDLFYVNEFDLSVDYIQQFPQPFDTLNLPKIMKKKSLYGRDAKLSFFELLSPKISGDFLNGISLSVFRREKWVNNVNYLDCEKLSDKRVFSNFDNTYPHIKIFAKGFSKSNTYFHAAPLSVCLTGAREWAPMYSYVRSVRLVEGVDEYRKNGLPLLKYLLYKNRSLNAFFPDMVYIFLNKESSGYRYFDFSNTVFKNIFYPEFYLSLILFPVRFPVIKYIKRKLKTGSVYPQAK